MPKSTKLTGGKLESSLSLERVKPLFTVIQSMNTIVMLAVRTAPPRRCANGKLWSYMNPVCM